MSAADKNLTGEQIQQTLDLFLYKALEPIVLNSNVFDSQVRYVLSVISQNRKRRLSSLDRNLAIQHLCKYLALTRPEDRQEKFRIIRDTRIERSFTHTFISKFLTTHSDYLTIYNQYLTSTKEDRKFLKNSLDLIAESVGCDRQGLYRIMNITQSYLTKFYNYRAVILGHYVKHSSNQAKQYIRSNSALNFDFKDARQSILKSILIAIDKYDSNKGALTSYVNWWILNAQTSSTSDHEYGIAYTIPQSHRKKIANHTTGDINFSVSLDSLSSGDDDDNDKNLHSTLSDKITLSDNYIKQEFNVIVQYLAKSVDPHGCARLYLDVGEFFSDKELNRMRIQMKNENCK